MVKVFMTIASVAFVTQVHAMENYAMEDYLEGMPLLAKPVKDYGTALPDIVIFNNQSKWPVIVQAMVHAENPISYSSSGSAPFEMEVLSGEKRGFGTELLPLIFDGESPQVIKIDIMSVRFPNGFEKTFTVSLNTRNMLSLISESPLKKELRFEITSF